jgi:nucleotide-binding universal stress UspA family protein
MSPGSMGRLAAARIRALLPSSRERSPFERSPVSPNSAAALRRAAAEARRRHARLDVVRVIPRAGGFRRTLGAWLRLRNEVARLVPRTQHVSTRLRIARGDASAELNRLADRAELLVIGARLNSRRGAPLSGDTVPAVLSGAPCGVIVCEGDVQQEA